MKKLTVLLILIVSFFSLSSCNLHIEDNNGENDYSLSIITDEEIINGRNTSVIFSSSLDWNNVCKRYIKKFSGVVIVKEFKLNNQDINLNVSTTTTLGNARYVAILNDCIIHDFEINELNQEFNLTNVNGKLVIKIAGESAEVRMEIEY